MRFDVPARSCLPLLLGALAACSDGARGPAHYERLRLARAVPLSASDIPRARVVQTLTVDGGTPWQLPERGCERVPGEHGGTSVACRGRGKRVLGIPYTLQPASFNRIEVRGIFPGVHTVKMTLRRKDGSDFAPPSMATAHKSGVQSVAFDMPRLYLQPRPFDELVLDITGPEPYFQIDGVDLVYEPLSLKLPDPDGEPDLVDVGGESRRAVGIRSGEPLVCEFDATRGDALRFSYGQPDFLREQGRSPVLTVALRSGSTERVHRFDFDPPTAPLGSWHAGTVSLEAYYGRRVRARFEVHAEGDTPVIAALASVAVERPGRDAPTVLLVTSDTHRADHLGIAHLGVVVETPTLDALANRGTLFEDCYSPTNVTSPSHVSIMTGVHPRDTRLVSNQGHMEEQARTLAEAFHAQGWVTYGVASVRHLGPLGTGLGQGFDRMIAPNGGTWTAAESIGHLESWLPEAEGLPLFAWVHLFDAHHPYEPPEDYDRRYYPKDKDPFDPSLPALDAVAGNIPADLVGLRDIEFPRAQYRAEVSYLDHELERLLGRPRFAQGWVAVTADHGEILEKDGSYFNHGELFPDTLHVPLILAGPGIEPAQRVERSVELVDLGRTLLDLAGLPHSPFPGRDLFDAGDSDEVPRFALSAHGNSASVTFKGWFGLLHLRSHQGTLRARREQHQMELFYLPDDPECLHDLSVERHREARRFREQIVEWLGRASAEGFASERATTAAAVEELQGMGYSTDTDVSTTWIDPDCDCDRCREFEE